MKKIKELKFIKNKKMKLAKKILITIAILILNGLGFLNCVYAVNVNQAKMDKAHLYSTGDCGSLLTYKGGVVKVSYVEYVENGQHYPAYCLDKTKPGAETNPYDVSVQDAIHDVGLWRRIINGYPYKTIQELGVANKEEAFTATKQAVYCYIHKNNPEDYKGIGEAGERTLRAMKQIINEAENSTENKISNTLTIRREQEEWKQDTIDKEYVSKTFSVNSLAQIENYKITLKKENAQDIGGIKLTDENNQEKDEFNANEKFKVLIPIKNLTQKGELKLEVNAKVRTKPVLYGIAPSSNYQDYALTTASYEEGSGIIKDVYDKNETKIIIVKKEEGTNQKLQGVEFALLNEKEEMVLDGLKTDKEGKIEIENLLPGRYFLKEVNTLDGYIKYDELIKVDVDMNQQVTVTVNNRKEEKPEIEVNKKEISVSNQEVKRLPVTGK